ncbi:unnamed protein product [Camellia sinensis]
MSGQFTRSCRTDVEANRNQCRDSLWGHVGPMEKLTGINVGTVYGVMSDRCRRHCMSVYIGCPKDIHVYIYRALKSHTLKRRAHCIKSRARQKSSSGEPSKVAPDTQRCT